MTHILGHNFNFILEYFVVVKPVFSNNAQKLISCSVEYKQFSPEPRGKKDNSCEHTSMAGEWGNKKIREEWGKEKERLGCG